jgi:hypothetical protein
MNPVDNAILKRMLSFYSQSQGQRENRHREEYNFAGVQTGRGIIPGCFRRVS